MKARLALAVVFFVGWLVILLAGADRPPPPGFVWVVLLNAVAAGIVYVRSATYTNWIATQRRNRVLRVVLEGFGVGIVIAALVTVVNPSGEPSVAPPSWIGRIIWFVVLGLVGAVNALLVYWASSLIYRFKSEQQKFRK